MNQPTESILSIKQKVFAGDKRAYDKLKTFYLDHSPEDVLFWALYMANRYDYPKASFDVFYCITNTYIKGELDDFSQIDAKTQLLLREHLENAAAGGVEEAQEILKEINSKNSNHE